MKFSPPIPSCSNENFCFHIGDYSFGFNGKDKESEFNSGAYDFGARIHDARLGRWMSVDAEMDRAPDWTPYRFGFNNPLIFTDKLGNFEISPELKSKYPKVALLLENAYNLYYNIPLPADVEKALEGVDYNAVFNNVLRSAFEEMSTLDDCQIEEMLTLGNGPLVSVGDLGKLDENGDNVNVNGKNECEFENGVFTDKNKKREDGKSGEIVIDKEVVGVLEFELNGEEVDLSGLGGKTRSLEDKSRAFLSFMSTVFHEVTHWGRNETGVGNTEGVNGTKGEPGVLFEEKAFGSNIGRTTVDSLLNSDGSKPKTAPIKEEE